MSGVKLIQNAESKTAGVLWQFVIIHVSSDFPFSEESELEWRNGELQQKQPIELWHGLNCDRKDMRDEIIHCIEHFQMRRNR